MDELIGELQAVADSAKNVPVNGWPNLNNKWLARSGLQKAIRRGNTQEALTCGANLSAADPDGAWRALATIIVEDVGIVDPDLLTYSTVVGLKTLRQKIDSPARLFMGMTMRACGNEVKSRSACELSLGADKDPVMNWTALNKATDEELLALMAGNSPEMMYAATCIVRRRAPKTDGLMDKALQIMLDSLGVGSTARAAMMSFERPIDTMNHAVWPLLFHKFQATELVTHDVLPPCPKIGGVMAAAWDMHTLHGKRAIKAFHTSLVNQGDEVMKALAAKSEDVVKGIGSIVFIVEGGQLAPGRLWSDSLAALKQYQDKNFSAAWGCPPELFEPVRQTVLNKFDLLNEKRVWSSKS